MLQLVNISKNFEQDKALVNVSLNVNDGQIVSLIGPSGCGKSTLLKLVMGLLQPDTGQILLDGSALDPKTILQTRRKMGYVIQEGGLFPHLSVMRNITIVAEFLGWPMQRIRKRLDELTDLTQLPAQLLARFPLQLSGGQRQRVSLMRALMLDPNILLLDEPLGALDPLIRADLQDDLKQIFQKLNKTVLLVTHDMGEAAFFSDQIVLMREGFIVQQGQLNELVKNPAEAFVTSFINAQRSHLDALIGEEKNN